MVFMKARGQLNEVPAARRRATRHRAEPALGTMQQDEAVAVVGVSRVFPASSAFNLLLRGENQRLTINKGSSEPSQGKQKQKHLVLPELPMTWRFAFLWGEACVC